MERRFRSRHGRAAVIRAALIVFLLASALTAAIVFTLDRNARRSNHQQAVTELASVARVSASTFSTMQANLRTRVGELAGSAAVQQAVLTRNAARLRSLARTDHARIVVHGRAFGTLPKRPRIAATATITERGRVMSHVTIAVPMNLSLVGVLTAATPMPDHVALVLTHDGQVIAGGPAGASVAVRHGELRFGTVPFVATAAKLGVPGASIIAVEPVAAVNTHVDAYRRKLLFAAAITLALAAGLATRLSRPVARVLGDLARLRHQAQTDALTNIANRRALDERLEAEIDHARRVGTRVSFLIADIDDFKSVNDRHGHQTGDEVLREVARVFADAVRELDLPGRYGGEEIAVVLPWTNLTGARNLAERIRKSVEELSIPTPDGESLQVTVSLGAACFPTHQSVVELVAAADASLYEAKRSGKNRVVTATAKKKAALQGLGEALAQV